MSQAAESPDILVDVTPPQGFTCKRFEPQEETALLYTLTPSFLHRTLTAELRVDVEQPGDPVKVYVFAASDARPVSGYLGFDDLKTLLHFIPDSSGKLAAEHTFVCPKSGNNTVSVVVDAEAGSEIIARLYRCSDTVVSAERAVSLRQVS